MFGFDDGYEEGPDGRLLTVSTIRIKRRWWQFWKPPFTERKFVTDVRSMSFRPLEDRSRHRGA